MKKTSLSNPVKSLGYIKCYSTSIPRPVKSPSNSIRYNCWKMEIRKRPYILDGEESYCLQFLSKTLLTIKRRLTGYIFKDILKYRDHWLELPIIMKSWLLQTHSLKVSASMYESSGSQFLRTTTGIQSGPEALEKSRSVRIFLAILGGTKICSFR